MFNDSETLHLPAHYHRMNCKNTLHIIYGVPSIILSQLYGWTVFIQHLIYETNVSESYHLIQAEKAKKKKAYPSKDVQECDSQEIYIFHIDMQEYFQLFKEKTKLRSC